MSFALFFNTRFSHNFANLNFTYNKVKYCLYVSV